MHLRPGSLRTYRPRQSKPSSLFSLSTKPGLRATHKIPNTPSLGQVTGASSLLPLSSHQCPSLQTGLIEMPGHSVVPRSDRVQSRVNPYFLRFALKSSHEESVPPSTLSLRTTRFPIVCALLAAGSHHPARFMADGTQVGLGLETSSHESPLV